MVAGDSERHQLFERHLVGGVEVEHLRRDGGELQPLRHDRGADKEAGGDLLLAEALLAQGLDGAELVERVQRDAVDVLGERIPRRRDPRCAPRRAPVPSSPSASA
jgi:hypothetical protein